MNRSSRPPRAVVFDIDGTLLPGTTVCHFLAERMGHLEMIVEMEAAWHAYEIDNRTFSRRDAVNYRGVPVAEVEARLVDLPLIVGLDEVCRRLAEAKVPVKLASCTWSFAGRYLQRRLELDGHCGTEMAEADGVLLGRVARFCNERDKAAHAVAFARGHGIDISDCVAVGDSRSDVPLFEAAGRAIALNARPDARAATDEHLDTGDLRDLLPLLGL
ncbi:MAG: haloacid dehalogenase-like hydrolase [Alphaproteobacteria bacterium]|jgi:phosphoserine phosphatase|nr:haloacid dehalogenase-like hydrolase [Alphaproteobacteria bacterium]